MKAHLLEHKHQERKDISHEQYRIYDFGNGKVVKIGSPINLIISQNGHRVDDENGFGHYIPYGWIHIYWKNKDDSDRVVLKV